MMPAVPQYDATAAVGYGQIRRGLLWDGHNNYSELLLLIAEQLEQIINTIHRKRN